MPDNSKVWLADGTLRAEVEGQCFEMLREMDTSIGSFADEETGGVFISFDGLPERSEHALSLGLLQSERIHASARTKRWWIGPSFGTRARDVPPETQFLLVQLGPDAYAVLLPLVVGPMRATLRGRKGDDDVLELLANSGDRATRTSGMEMALYVRAGSDPFELLSTAFATVARRVRSFDVRANKRAPADLTKFGWCTWDAFYQAVDPAGVTAGLRSLHAAGTPAGVLILDDGWQTVEDDGDALAATKASRKLAAKAAKAAKKAAKAATAATAAKSVSAAAAAVDECVLPAVSAKAALVCEDEVRAVQKANDPASHGGDSDDAHPVVSLVGEWYRKHVDGADLDTTPVRAWRALAHSVFKPFLRGFFVTDTEFSKRLAAFPANSKFEDAEAGTSLRGLLASLRGELGPLRVYCWHTLGGYWGGVSTTAPAMAHLHARQHKPRPTRSLLEVEPALGWDAAAMCGVGAIGEGHELDLFRGIHTYLAQSGVDGVKIDAQSGMGVFGDGMGGGPAMVRRQVRAMEASVREHFPGNRCINCMAHSSENLFGYQSTSTLRAADDFYPSEPESHPVHLCQVAYNSLFLGEIGHVDWDMFQSHHADAAMHAAARAVGGCPIYVSDRPGKHNLELLRRLVLPDGTTLVAQHAGRPTRDTLFADVNSDGVNAMKVWNVNRVTGILAAFNVQGARWDRAHRRFVGREEVPTVVAALRPSDVEGLHERAAERCTQANAEDECDVAGAAESAASSGLSAVYLHQQERVHVVGNDEAVELRLTDREWEVATVSPIATARDNSAHFAALGLLDMLNGGGAIASSRLSAPFGRGISATVQLSATGTFGAYCMPEPRAVRLDGQPVEFVYDAASHMLRVPIERAAAEAELVVEFPRRWPAAV